MKQSPTYFKYSYFFPGRNTCTNDWTVNLCYWYDILSEKDIYRYIYIKYPIVSKYTVYTYIQAAPTPGCTPQPPQGSHGRLVIQHLPNLGSRRAVLRRVGIPSS